MIGSAAGDTTPEAFGPADARVAELVDAADLKSASPSGEREFESRPGHLGSPLVERDPSLRGVCVGHGWANATGQQPIKLRAAGINLVREQMAVHAEREGRAGVAELDLDAFR
jgi:hypothetical protein